VTTHRPWRSQELRRFKRFGYPDLLRCEAHEQFVVLNRLKPVDGTFVVGRVQFLNRRTIGGRRGYRRMNMRLLKGMMVLVAARFVYMKKWCFDESRQQRTRQP
jgi:hypothetical protein